MPYLAAFGTPHQVENQDNHWQDHQPCRAGSRTRAISCRITGAANSRPSPTWTVSACYQACQAPQDALCSINSPPCHQSTLFFRGATNPACCPANLFGRPVSFSVSALPLPDSAANGRRTARRQKTNTPCNPISDLAGAPFSMSI